MRGNAMAVGGIWKKKMKVDKQGVREKGSGYGKRQGRSHSGGMGGGEGEAMTGVKERIRGVFVK